MIFDYFINIMYTKQTFNYYRRIQIVKIPLTATLSTATRHIHRDLFVVGWQRHFEPKGNTILQSIQRFGIN